MEFVCGVDLFLRSVTTLAIIAGVCVAIWKLNSDHAWRESEASLTEAKQFLEHAYHALMVEPETGYPVNDRHT